MRILSPVIGRCPSFVSLRLFLINQRHVELREDNQVVLRSVPAGNDVDQGEKLAAIPTPISESILSDLETKVDRDVLLNSALSGGNCCISVPR